jgi:hypothetical protein
MFFGFIPDHVAGCIENPLTNEFIWKSHSTHMVPIIAAAGVDLR